MAHAHTLFGPRPLQVPQVNKPKLVALLIGGFDIVSLQLANPNGGEAPLLAEVEPILKRWAGRSSCTLVFMLAWFRCSQRSGNSGTAPVPKCWLGHTHASMRAYVHVRVHA